MICAIVPAAGRSRRMGGSGAGSGRGSGGGGSGSSNSGDAGGPVLNAHPGPGGGGVQKLLLPVAGKPLIAHVVDQLLCALPAGSRVIVVTRAGDAGVAGAIAARPVELVANPLPEGDMLSSIRAGIQAAPAGCQGFLVAPGDHPAVPADVVQQMIAAFASAPGKIIVPTSGGRPGHPLLFPAAMKDDVLSQFDGEGLRGLLRLHADAVVKLPVDSPGVLEDIDTPEDYRRLAGGR